MAQHIPVQEGDFVAQKGIPHPWTTARRRDILRPPMRIRGSGRLSHRGQVQDVLSTAGRERSTTNAHQCDRSPDAAKDREILGSGGRHADRKGEAYVDRDEFEEEESPGSKPKVARPAAGETRCFWASAKRPACKPAASSRPPRSE